MKYVILLLLILFIVACTPDGCKDDDACYFDKAVSTNEVVHCSKIASPQIKKSCYAEIAIKSKDLELCRSIGSNYCISEIALADNDAVICQTIDEDNDHDVCIRDIESI